MPTIGSITDRLGPLTLEGLTASGRKASFKSATTETGGLLTLTVGGTGTGDFTVAFKVKTAKSNNDDKFAVAWPIGDPGGITTHGTNEANLPAGTTFAQAGCAVACHGNLGMAPPNGLIDLWHWKTSRSNPLGCVNDQWGGNGTSRSTDTNQTIESRNRVSDNTSGPTKVLNPEAPKVLS